MTLQERMSENVRVVTAARRMTAGELASAMGVARTSIVAKLVGRVRWNLDDVERVAAALELEPATLVGADLALTVAPVQTARAAADSAAALASVRPKGLEPPTF